MYCSCSKHSRVHSKWRNIERHSKCILTALWLHSKYYYGPVTAFQQLHSKNSDRIRGRIETASHFKSCQNVPNAPRMSRKAPRMHLDCSRNLFDMKRIQLECTSNVVGIFRLPLECGSNAVGTSYWPSNESGRNSEYRRITYPGIYKEFPIRRNSDSFRL